MADLECDFLILGSGITGLYTAYQLAGFGSVIVVTKSDLFESNTAYAQGGIASVLAATDSFDSHIRDTLEAGAGLCDPEAVRVLVTEGPDHIRRLIDLGARFETDARGNLDLHREGGHSHNRIVHTGDLTGKEVEVVLADAVRARNVQVFEHHTVVDLITRYHVEGQKDPGAAEPTCFGAYVYNRKTWEISVIRSRATVLATGGAGHVYLHNTNPEVATGDGVALAYNAGAVITNMEFYQFHPTCLYDPRGREFLITEAMRGYGGRLLNYEGKAFMQDYDERKELAPRDIVARAIDAEMKKSGSPHVWLDVTHKPAEDLMHKFPNIYATCLSRGIDISRQPIPVVPAAHYMCGGVHTDLNGRTRLKGLYAAGEVAWTGVHGGNRLASNSLLEGLVFGSRVARELSDIPASSENVRIRPWNKEGLDNPEEWILVQHDFGEIRETMWNYVGIVRSDLRLDRALRRIDLLNDEIQDFFRRTVIQNKIIEMRNLALVARLIILSARHRKESRGLHYNTDYPENRTPSRRNTSLMRGPDGESVFL